MNHSMPGLPVHHQLPESTQTHVHRVGDTIQPSHPLSFPSPPAPNPSQHQGLFQWVNSSHEVAKVLEFQLQHQSFQWTLQWTSPLWWTAWISLQWDSQESSPTHSSKALILQCSAFFTVQLSHPYMTIGKTIDLTRWTFGKVMSLLFNMLSRLVIALLPRSKHLLISWLQSPSKLTHIHTHTAKTQLMYNIKEIIAVIILTSINCLLSCRQLPVLWRMSTYLVQGSRFTLLEMRVFPLMTDPKKLNRHNYRVNMWVEFWEEKWRYLAT